MSRYIHFLLLILFAAFSSSVFAQESGEENPSVVVFPQNNSVLEGFSKGDSILFKTSFDSICGGFHERLIEDDTKNIIYDAFNSIKTDSGSWLLKFYNDVTLAKGHTYTLEIVGHEVADSKSPVIGKVQVNYVGSGTSQQDDDDDYEYSNIKYLSFSPSENVGFTDVDIDFTIVEFTGDAIIDRERSKVFDEDGNSYDFVNFTPVEGHLYEQMMHIPRAVLLRSTSYVILRVYAKDLGGRTIKGNKGKGENSYYELKYNCEFGYPVISVYPSDRRYTSLKKFVFSNEEGIVLYNEENIIQLSNSSNGEVVRSFRAGDLTLDSDEASYSYTLEQPLNEIGTYQLVIPEGTFSIGKKMLDNKKTTILYEITNREKTFGIQEMDPADGSEVMTLSEISITFDRPVYPNYFNEEGITITNEKGDTIATAYAYKDKNDEDNKKCHVKLYTPITEPGEYTVHYPYGSFFLGDYEEDISSEMSFYYTVLGLPDYAYDVTIMTMPDQDETLKSILLTFNHFYWVGLVDNDHHIGYEVTLTDTLNNEVATAFLKLGTTNTALEVDSIQPKLSKGTYLLHIPNSILLMNDVLYEKELVIEINFDPAVTTAQYANASQNKDRVRVYNAQGMLARDEKDPEKALQGLRRGLYIINGRKILIK